MSTVATRAVDSDDLVSLAVAGLTERVRAHYRSYYNSYALFREAESANAALHELNGLDRPEVLLLFADYRAYLRILGRSAHLIADHISALRRAVRQAKRSGRRVPNVERKHLATPAIKGGSVSIAAFEKEVLGLYEPPRMCKASYTKFKKAFRILSDSGLVWVADLTLETVRNLENSWKGKDEARRDFRNSLHRICSLAIERGYLRFNPVPQTEQYRKKSMPLRKRIFPSRGKIPNATEVDCLLAHLKENADAWNGFRLYALVATAIYMDFFHSEAIYLRPADCDLTRSIITLNHGRRSPLVLRIPEPLAPILGAWLPWCGSAWLFPGRAKTSPWTSDAAPCGVNGQIREAGIAVGIEGLTFESLRRFGQEDDPSLPLIEPGVGKNVWIIMGLAMEPLTKKPHIRAIENLYNAWREERRLKLTEMGDDRKVLKDIKALHQHWESIIDAPEKEGNRGHGYGFKDPRISI